MCDIAVFPQVQLENCGKKEIHNKAAAAPVGNCQIEIFGYLN